MLRYIYADQLHLYPNLSQSMFRDRAEQFKTRLGWDVTVDENGLEKDQYDTLNPLYVIWEQADGSHGGSMRLLPTTGRTMVNEHFAHVIGGGAISSPVIWECTRFCLAPGAASRVATALMMGGSEVMRNFGIDHYVGVFDARMIRVYRMVGSSPEVLGAIGEGREQISVGLWHYNAADREMIVRRAGVSMDVSELWFERSFGSQKTMQLAQAV